MLLSGNRYVLVRDDYTLEYSAHLHTVHTHAFIGFNGQRCLECAFKDLFKLPPLCWQSDSSAMFNWLHKSTENYLHLFPHINFGAIYENENWKVNNWKSVLCWTLLMLSIVGGIITWKDKQAGVSLVQSRSTVSVHDARPCRLCRFEQVTEQTTQPPTTEVCLFILFAYTETRIVQSLCTFGTVYVLRIILPGIPFLPAQPGPGPYQKL